MAINYGPRHDYAILEFITTGQTMVLDKNGSISVDMYKSGSNSWDTQAYCPTPFTAPCTLEFNKTASTGDDGNSYVMIGWNADPLTDASYSSIDWAAYPYRTDNYVVYHNGSQIVSSGVWSPLGKFYLVYDTDGFIRHYNGSTLLASFNKGTGGTVFIDSSFYVGNSTNGKLSNVRAIRRAWNGTQYNL
jgi:hypothetical protein